MRYRVLGRRGPRVSVIGLGLWQAGSRAWGSRGPGALEAVRRGLLEAVEYGISFFDTAEIYGGGASERLLGETLGNRDDVVVASKVAGYRWTRGSIVKAAEGIRRRLRRDRVDLLQHHWPPPLYASVCSVVRGLEDAVDRGLAEYIGVSNYPAPLLEEAYGCLRRYELVSDQVQYSLAYRVVENRLVETAGRLGVGIIAWSPLAKGALAGRRAPTSSAERLDPVFRRATGDEELLSAIRAVAERRGATMAQVALAWLIAKGALPIPGFRRPERVRENAAVGDLILSEEDVRLLDRASEKYVRLYGDCYESLRSMRLVPGILQHLAIRLLGGI